MNANGVAKNYGRLTPEERFRLILAATGRGDEAERERLARTGERITLRMPNHYPYAHAFGEVATLVFVELLEEAGKLDDAYHQADTALAILRAAEEDEDEDGDQAEETECAPEEEPLDEPADKHNGTRPEWLRSLELAYAIGYMLQTKANGWKLFCERWNIPPFLLWKELPGFDRLQRALDFAEKAAFRSDGFLSWLNRIRAKKEEPELTKVPPNATAEGMADAAEEMFQLRVKWWRG
jgi:hypothetical protein